MHNFFIITIYDYHYSKSYAAGTGGHPKSGTITIFEDFEDIEKLIPVNSPGYVYFYIYVKAHTWSYKNANTKLQRIHYWAVVRPKISQISLVTDGYQTINEKMAVQIYTSIVKSDQNAYVLSEYVLDPIDTSVYLFRDIYFDVQNDRVDIVYTMISADVYGQDVIDMNVVLNESDDTHDVFMDFKANIRFINGTIGLINYNNLKMLNIHPDAITWLINIGNYQFGYGTIFVVWSQVTFNTLNVSLGSLYIYYYNSWIRVTPQQIQGTLDYKIVNYDDTTITYEIIYNGNVSSYLYKWDNTTHVLYGKLYNDNGTLVFIKGGWFYSISEAEMQQLIAQMDLQGIYDQWATTWNDIATTLGLIKSTIAKTLSGTTSKLWTFIKYASIFLIVILILIIIANMQK